MMLGGSSSNLNIYGGDVDSTASTIIICGEALGMNKKVNDYTNAFFASYNLNYVPNFFYTIEAGFSNSQATKCLFGD